MPLTGTSFAEIAARYLKEHPDEKLSAREIAERIKVTFPDEYENNWKNNPRRLTEYTDVKFLNQVVREIGNRDLERRDYDIGITADKPKKYYYLEKSRFRLADHLLTGSESEGEKSTKTQNLRKLKLKTLQRLLANERDKGGLIYIKKADKKGNPMQFSIDIGTASAVSGKWRHGLANGSLSWILVYHRIDHDKGEVWLGDYEKSEPITVKGKKLFNIHIANLVGPLKVEQSFRDLVGRDEPQIGPIYAAKKNGVGGKNDAQSAESTGTYLVDEILDLLPSVIADTEIQQQILARLGQGKFRGDVLKLWDNACAVTGSKTKEVLRASHIRPWCDSDDKDRLNPMNGFPLVATLDALFDRGLITFEDNGRMLISEKISANECKLFGLNSTSRLLKILEPEHKKFLGYHRTKFQKNHNAKVFEA